MNFREHKNVKVTILADFTPSKLQAKVNKFCEGIELVDLRYSTHGISTFNGSTLESFSVLILYKEKEIK